MINFLSNLNDLKLVSELSYKELLFPKLYNINSRKLLYKLGYLLDISVKLTKLLNSSKLIQDIYKYKLIVDSSDRGFDCSNAEALYRDIKDRGSLEDIVKLINIVSSNKIKV